MTTHNDLEVGSKHEVQHIDLPGGIQDDPKAIALAQEYVPGTAEEKRLVRKMDLHLMPILWVMYIFNYIDRTNIGNAKVGGMAKDLALTSSDYSLVLSIFFVAYLLFEVPSNMILAKSKPSIFLPTLMVIWGAISVGVKGVHNIGGMIAFRIALGLVEAGFFPGVMLLLSCWYKPAELSKRIAFFYTASLLSGAFGGLLAGGIIEGMEGLAGTRGWKWLFMIEGMATVCVGAAAYFILPNFPATTSWLTEDERRLAQIRLAIREDLDEHVTHGEAVKRAFRDPKTWLFMLAYNVLTATGTISYFFPTLMGALGYKGRHVQFMTVPIYFISLIFALAFGWNADRTGKKAWHLLAACALGTVSFVIVAAVRNNAARYAFICFGGAGVWSAVPLFLSWMVTMFPGREQRGISIALINGLGNLASIYGSFIWPSKDAPNYVMGFAITTAFMGLSGLIAFTLNWLYGDKGHAATRVEEEERR